MQNVPKQNSNKIWLESAPWLYIVVFKVVVSHVSPVTEKEQIFSMVTTFFEVMQALTHPKAGVDGQFFHAVSPHTNAVKPEI